MSMNMSSDSSSDFEKYRYEPSMAAAILFIVLFTATTLFHTWQMSRARTWFMVPFCIGGIFETIGYIGRTISASENPGPYALGPYILQSVTILVAPALFGASIYMELGRIVAMLRADAQLIFKRAWLTKIFVAGDVVSFMAQAAGAGLMASEDKHKTGEYIIVAGLFLQITFFGLFVVTAGLFHWRHSRAPTSLSNSRPWKKHMISLYAVSLLIFVRSIVRVVEFIQGFEGYIISHEAFLYIFDAMVMLFAILILYGIHPCEVAQSTREDDIEDKVEHGCASVVVSGV